MLPRNRDWLACHTMFFIYSNVFLTKERGRWVKQLGLAWAGNRTGRSSRYRTSCARSGKSGGKVIEVREAFQAARNIRKTAKKRAVSCTFWLINRRKRCFSHKSTLQNIITRHFLRNMSTFKITIYAIAELYLFKVSEVIYAPSQSD